MCCLDICLQFTIHEYMCLQVLRLVINPCISFISPLSDGVRPGQCVLQVPWGIRLLQPEDVLAAAS